MESRLVFVAFIGVFDGCIQYHEGYSQDEQKTDEQHYEHRFRKKRFETHRLI